MQIDDQIGHAIASQYVDVVLEQRLSRNRDHALRNGIGERAQTIYGGYLVISQEGGPESRVPYAGFCGDYQSLPALTIGGVFDLPWLAQKEGRTYTRRLAGATYTMAGEDIPYFILHLDHQPSLFRMEVFDAVTGRAWHRAFQRKRMPRSPSAGDAFVLAWNGLTTHGKQIESVPNGRYVMKISALRALGDEDNPAHWDIWTSPVITLARPDEHHITGVAALEPLSWELAPPNPNPSSAEVSFRFATPSSGPVAFEVFDVSGRRLKSWRWASLPGGEHLVRWDGADDRGAQAPAGAVLCRLTAQGRTLARMAVRLR